MHFRFAFCFFVAGTALFGASAAWAKTPTCKYDFTSSISVNEALERAAHLEFELTQAVSGETYAHARRAYDQLARLQIIIDDILERPPNANVRDLWEQIDRVSDRQIGDSDEPTAQTQDKLALEVKTRARKDYDSLPPYLMKKYDEFAQEVRRVGLSGLEKRWVLERLNAFTVDVSEAAAYSVRLNHGYRVVLGTSAPGLLAVYRISKTVTHLN